MATITLPLIELEKGRCYVITGTTDIGATESAQFSIGNDSTTDLIGTVSSSGDFTLNVPYATTATYYKNLYITESGTFNITNLEFKLDSSCAMDYCSECFTLNDCTEPEYLTLEWTNDDDGFGLDYTSVPLAHSLTVKGGLRNADYQYDEDYFNTSFGKYFPVYVDSVKTQEMWIERVPEYIHDALRIGLVHDVFTINNVQYSKVEGGYSPDWDTPNSLMAPVIVKVRKTTQNTKNINC